jgi:MbtH protein
MDEQNPSTRRYLVLMNDEEQYSLWPAGKTVPSGWHAVAPEGTEQECLDYVDRAWTDMRPASLRRAMQ